jgi:truncated hemoglobin YjbI
MNEPTVYAQVGEEKMALILRQFYDEAFEDPMIGHFFFGKDKEALIQKQLDFTSQLLGGPPNRYLGQPIPTVHRPLGIRKVHFMRRQRILNEILEKEGLSSDLRRAWLMKEEALAPIIINQKGQCL